MTVEVVMARNDLASAGSDRFDFRVSTIWPDKSRGRGFNPALHRFHIGSFLHLVHSSCMVSTAITALKSAQ